jgi:hypothetical protein
VRALLFDPFAGISGDMTLGALIDLGLPAEWLGDFVADLALGDVDVRVTRAERRGIACTKVDFELPHQHAHRHLSHIVEMIAGSRAPELAKQRAIRAFRSIAVAEAAVHGTTIEKVHFHEVGALDAILDILCSMAAVQTLGFEAFFTRAVALGSGWVDMAHGRFPVPAPATLKILEGMVVTGANLAGECTTPTGAAILATLTAGAAPPAAFVTGRTGFGGGARDPADRPNCLRVIEIEVDPTSAETLLLVQTDVDDLPPEYAAEAQEAVLAAGALDVVVLSVGMKKGRPGLRFEALVPAPALHAVTDALFRSTSTIGVRHWPVSRPALPRVEELVQYRGQSIRVKTVTLPGGALRRKPEYEDVVHAARALGLSALHVRADLERDAHGASSEKERG